MKTKKTSKPHEKSKVTSGHANQSSKATNEEEIMNHSKLFLYPIKEDESSEGHQTIDDSPGFGESYSSA